MANKVADILVVAHRAAVQAVASKKPEDLENAVSLAFKALTHPEAEGFFSLLDSVAGELREIEGHDPDVEDNDESALDPSRPDPEYDENAPDEDSDAASPADEGLVNHDEGDDKSEEDDGRDAEQSGVARIVTPTRRLAATVAANLRRA